LGEERATGKKLPGGRNGTKEMGEKGKRGQILIRATDQPGKKTVTQRGKGGFLTGRIGWRKVRRPGSRGVVKGHPKKRSKLAF